MTNEEKSEQVQLLRLHPEVPLTAKRDLQLLGSAIIQMDSALKRLPRAMHWSIQPIAIFTPVAANRHRN